MAKQTRWQQLRSEWAILTLYQRFESLVALVLTAVIGLIIVVALFRRDDRAPGAPKIPVS